jgi:hypothetical protein
MTDQEPEILSGLPCQLPYRVEISRELVAGDIPLDAGREPVIAFSFDPDKSPRISKPLERDQQAGYGEQLV